jgi:hypothetical protein
MFCIFYNDYSIKMCSQLGMVLIWFLVFDATYNKISVISWRSVLLLEETGVLGEIHRPVASR